MYIVGVAFIGIASSRVQLRPDRNLRACSACAGRSYSISGPLLALAVQFDQSTNAMDRRRIKACTMARAVFAPLTCKHGGVHACVMPANIMLMVRFRAVACVAAIAMARANCSA